MTTSNRNYRVWTEVEDEKLVEALLNMTNTGKFKSDNSFRTGYIPHLEASLKESLPESGILGKPHIESRIKTMKKDWQIVYDMLNASGFGYDKETNLSRLMTKFGIPILRRIKRRANGKIKSFLTMMNCALYLVKTELKQESQNCGRDGRRSEHGRRRAPKK